MLALPPVYWVLFVGVLVNRLGGFVFPFLALYLTGQRGFTAERAGAVVSLWGAGALISALVGGWLADHIGRRRTILVGLVLGAAAMAHLGVARAPLHIAVATFLLGCVADLYRPAVNASVADLVAPADRTRAYGYLYWAHNLGFASAAVVAGLFARSRFGLLFAVDALTTLAFAVIVAASLPETRPPRGDAPLPPGGHFAPYRDGVFLSFLATQFLVVLLFHQGHVTLAIDLRAHGISEATYGTLIAENGVLIVLLQPWATRVVARRRRARVLALGALLTGVGYGLNAVFHTVPLYGVAIAVWTAGELAFSPVTPTVVADLAPPTLRGGYQGGLHMVWGLSSFVAPLLGGFVLGRFGARALWLGCLGAGALAAALHFVIAPARRRRLLTNPHGDADPTAREDGRAPARIV